MLRPSATSAMHSAKSRHGDAALADVARSSAAICLRVVASRPATAARAIRLRQSKALVANGTGRLAGLRRSWPPATARRSAPARPAPAPAICVGRRPAPHGVVDDDRRRIVTGHDAGRPRRGSDSMRGALLGVADDDDDAGVAVAARWSPRRARLSSSALNPIGSGTVDAPGAQRGDRRLGERPAVGVVEVDDGRRQRAGALGLAGDRRRLQGVARRGAHEQRAVREVVEGEGGRRRRARQDAGPQQVAERGQGDGRRRRADDGVDVLRR